MRIDWKEATVLCLVSTLIAVAILFVGQLTSLWGRSPSGALPPEPAAAQGTVQTTTPPAVPTPDSPDESVFAPLTPRERPTTPAARLSTSAPAPSTTTTPTQAPRQATSPAPTPRVTLSPPAPAAGAAGPNNAARPSGQPSPAPATPVATPSTPSTARNTPLTQASTSPQPAPDPTPSEAFGQRVASGVLVRPAQVQARTPAPAAAPSRTPGTATATGQATAGAANRATPQAARPATPTQTPAPTAARPPSPAPARVPSGPEPVPSSPSRAPAPAARTPAPSSSPVTARELTPEPTAPAEIGADVSPPADPGVSMNLLVRGRELARLLYGGQLDQLWAKFGPEARSQWGDLSTLAAYRSSSPESHWTEERLLREEVRNDGDGTAYLRTVTYQDDPGTPWTVIFRLGPDGTVSHFEVSSAEPN